MPRALKSDKFFIRAPKKRGHHKGRMLLGTDRGDEVTVQDLLDFLKEKGVDPAKVPLPRSFSAYANP